MLCVYKMQELRCSRSSLGHGSRSDTAVKPDKQETHCDAALDPKGKLQVLATCTLELEQNSELFSDIRGRGGASNACFHL